MSFNWKISITTLYVQTGKNDFLNYYIIQRVYTINEDDPGFMEYKPVSYGYEGEGSRCQSLDQLSITNQDDDLHFLDDLGPKFKTLGEISKNFQSTQM